MTTTTTTNSNEGDENTPSSSHSSKKTQETKSIDIRYFFIIILSSISVFFLLGVLTAPPTQRVQQDGVRTATPSSALEILFDKPDDDLNEHHVNFEEPTYEDLGTGGGAIQRSSSSSSSDTATIATSGDGDGAGGGNGGLDQQPLVNDPIAVKQHEPYLPAGQHLLVDMRNLQAEFLNSEQRLANAMIETIQKGGLTLLSYHCHSLIPTGVSCVGVLLESHISFHTWPEEGVITLDLFTCGKNPLLPIVPEIKKLFGVPRKKNDVINNDNNNILGDDTMDDQDVISSNNGDGTNEEEIEEVITNWSHELRGFRVGESYEGATKTNYLDNKSDLATWVITPLNLEMKKQIVATTNTYHRIDIWDIITHDARPSYDDALEHNLTEGDPRWLSNEIASPTRILFINGALVTLSTNEREYKESLVHPVMFTHPNPVNVVVIGGSDGGSIRELLKHETVQSITILQQDEKIIEITREHLSSVNDCSDIIDVKGNCFDDERVNIVSEDPKSWFSTEKSALFDVIIFDTLAPNDAKELYTDEAFLNIILDSLHEDGIISTPLGEAHIIHDPRAELSKFATRETFMKILEANDKTGAMFVYEEGHTGLNEPSSFLTVCKNVKCRDLWYSEAMVIDYKISKRIKETKSKKPILLHFDGTTHESFQIPPRAWEEVYCRREPIPFECDYRGIDFSREIFEMDIENEDESSFTITSHIDNEKETKTIYATVDIPKGSYIMPSDLASSFTISKNIIDKLKSNAEIKDTGDVIVIRKFLDFIESHGHDSISDGNTLRFVEVGASFVIRESFNEDEINVGRWMPHHPNGKQPVYSPVYDRHMISYDVFLIATKAIRKGEEIVKPTNLW